MPVRQELRFGQIDIFLVALCMLDCTVREPRWPRGALIGLATAIKLVPGVFIIYLLITGRRRAAAVAAGTFTAVTLLAWAIAPADSNLYWTTMIFDSSRLGPNGQAANQSVRGILMRIYSPEAPPLALWLGVALLVAAAGFTAAVVRPPARDTSWPGWPSPACWPPCCPRWPGSTTSAGSSSRWA